MMSVDMQEVWLCVDQEMMTAEECVHSDGFIQQPVFVLMYR